MTSNPPPDTGEIVEREGYAPCPVCKQWSHSLRGDAVAEAFMHFHSMHDHRGDGIPTQHNFDQRTRDAAQVLCGQITTLTARIRELEQQVRDNSSD